MEGCRQGTMANLLWCNICAGAGWVSENWATTAVSPSCPQLGRGKEVFLDEESTRVKSPATYVGAELVCFHLMSSTIDQGHLLLTQTEEEVFTHWFLAGELGLCLWSHTLLLLQSVGCLFFQMDKKARVYAVCLCLMVQVEGEGKAGENHGGLIGREGERDC